MTIARDTHYQLPFYFCLLNANNNVNVNVVLQSEEEEGEEEQENIKDEL